MKKLTVLVIGSGGREHALVWKLAQSPRVAQIFAAPGNAGTAELATNVPIAAADLPALFYFARSNKIDLTIVGPEDPLDLGIVDLFQAERLPIFGPIRAAAQLEASKAFAKAFMHEMGIPTARFGTFTDYAAAMAYLAEQDGPVVVKASGLAAGKGVIVCEDREAAAAALHQIMLDKEFGSAGDKVIIEERLTGPELSLLAFSDGRTVVPMLPARDHKRIFNGDEGPNTGGMGAFAPPPGIDATFIAQLAQSALNPVILGMAERGTPYVGVLYAGIMLAGAVRGYVNRYAVCPSTAAVVLTNNDSAYATATDLLDAGVSVAAIVDLRQDPPAAIAAPLRDRGIAVHRGSTVVAAQGRRRPGRACDRTCGSRSPPSARRSPSARWRACGCLRRSRCPARPPTRCRGRRRRPCARTRSG